MQRGLRQSNHGELAVHRALCFPVEGRSLWIGIDQQHRTMFGQRGSDMNGKRGFADAGLFGSKTRGWSWRASMFVLHGSLEYTFIYSNTPTCCEMALFPVSAARTHRPSFCSRACSPPGSK